MRLFYRIMCCVLIISTLSLTSGCASYRFGRLPSPYIVDHPDATTQKDVSVAVKFFTASEATNIFDCEMSKRSINPVFVVIENKSNQTYGFRKADADSSYMTCEESAKKCSRSTMGRILTYGILGLVVILWVVFIPMAIAEGINCPKINSQMRSDYCSNEIADASIGPNRSISGVMYVAPFKSGEAFTIPLLNKETGEKLVFQFYSGQMGSSWAPNEQDAETSKIVETKKEPDKTTTQPTQNFGAK